MSSAEPLSLRRTPSRLLRVLRINCSTDVVEKKKKITEENLSLPLGAGEGNRTPDLLITNQLLYRLSHASILSFVKNRTSDLLLNRAAVLAANVTSVFCEYYESIALPRFEHSSCGLWLQTTHRVVCLTRRPH